jgi:hypothetical protein
MIKHYKVERMTGLPGNTKTVESIFDVISSPIEVRRKAIDFAANLYAVITESSGPLPFNPYLPILSKSKDPGLNIIVSAVLDNDDELIISGDFLENLLESWDEEVQIYLDEGYIYDKKLYSVDASIFYLGYVTVFEDDYINYDLPNIIAEYEKED